MGWPQRLKLNKKFVEVWIDWRVIEDLTKRITKIVAFTRLSHQMIGVLYGRGNEKGSLRVE